MALSKFSGLGLKTLRLEIITEKERIELEIHGFNIIEKSKNKARFLRKGTLGNYVTPG